MAGMRAETRNEVAQQETGILPTPAEAGMVLMDMSFRPLAIERAAVAIFASMSDDGGEPAARLEGPWAIPNGILVQMRGCRPDDLPSFKIRFRTGHREYVGRTYLVETKGSSPGPQLVVLHLERNAALSDAISQVSAQYNLTDREKEALKGIAIGLTNKELAELMDVKVNTVKAFLRVIRIKLAVPSRAAILAK